MRTTLVLISLLGFSGLALAEDVTSCHTQASQAVAEWAGPVLKPAASSTGARPADSVLVIAHGQMHSYRPAAGNDVRIVRGLSEMVRSYNLTWRAEYERCIIGERGLVILRY